MRHWSLKIKFGVYAAGLVLVALAVAAAVMLPSVYFTQIRQLDRQLAGEAEELFRDLENFRGAPINPRRPLSARFIPVAMHDRLIVLKGPEGQLLYASPGLDDEDLEQMRPGFATISFGAEAYRIGVFREEPFHLEVGASVAPLRTLQMELVRGLVVAAPLTALVVFGLGFWLAKYAIRPVSALTIAAERISVNRLSETLPMPSTRDEIARLTEVLNDAFGRLKQSYEVATRFSADASHQLKTPLAVLRLGLGSLRASPDLAEDLRLEVDLLLRQTRRLTLLINELLLLAQADAGRLVLDRKQVELNPMIEAAMDDVETLTRDRRIEVETHLPDQLRVTADQSRFKMALQIITENAAKYTPDGGRIRLETSVRDGFLHLNLSNTGKAIPEPDRERIFERFHRGTSVGEETEGHGLGLNIARTLFRAHQGDLRLIRSDGEWTEFQLTMPV